MEPQNQPSPNQAPKPQGPEVQPVVQGGESQVEIVQPPAAAETAPDNKEAANQNSGMVLPPVQQSPVIPSVDPVANGTTNDATIIIPDTPDVAEDVDLIETEWVNKAKKIVHDTRDDPRQQKKQVSALKADYMKKRYGKDVKLSDD